VRGKGTQVVRLGLVCPPGSPSLAMLSHRSPGMTRSFCLRNFAAIVLFPSPMSIFGKLGGAAAGFMLGGGPIGALIGACAGFLWYNAYPAQVFMGDTGSLTLGGIIAALAIIVRKELLIPLFCGVFLVEELSVMIQVSYFKYTKKKHGEGRRIFLMSPLHHHYQKLGYHESKIVTRFWIVTILCVAFAIATLKIR